jgi:hypothetical protein
MKPFKIEFSIYRKDNKKKYIETVDWQEVQENEWEFLEETCLSNIDIRLCDQDNYKNHIVNTLLEYREAEITAILAPYDYECLRVKVEKVSL